MSDNELLLYRLVELMLLYERHMLPIDDLFEDEQIGDYIKNIQIDSPYQQLVNEGVLTESINDEIIYVSFTVEGYYHYLLGKIISNSTELSEKESLVSLATRCSLNGINEGIQYSLINEIFKGNEVLLIDLIDIERFPLENCIKPLAYCFIHAGYRSNYSNVIRVKNNNIFESLFSHPTERDFEIIRAVIKYISQINYDLANTLYLEILEFNHSVEYDQFKLLFMEALESLPIEMTKNVDLGLYESTSPTVQFELNVDKIRFLRRTNQHQLAHKYISENESLLVTGLIQISEKQKSIFYDSISFFYSDFGEYNKAKSSSLKALVHHNKTDSGYGIALNNLALFCIDLNEYDIAEKYLTEALDFDSKLNGNYCENTASRLGNLGYLYLLKGDYEKSLKSLQHALQIDKKLFGRYHENVATRLLNISDCLRNLNRNEEALETLKESREIDMRNYGISHPMVAASYNIESRIYLSQGRVSDAHAVLNKAIDINKIFNGGVNDHINRDYLFQGKLYSEEKNFDMALNSFIKADNIDDIIFADTPENRIVTWISICKTLKNMGKFDLENEYYLKLLALPAESLMEYKPHLEDLTQT
jgi:tetratricopeptide (TPR) repeat protein